ncbi:MAG: hypothetical protein K0R38_4666 [Polyangiaceae bacterium]|nr:hypothetical protein [Polyangiaceae bacterium]
MQLAPRQLNARLVTNGDVKSAPTFASSNGAEIGAGSAPKPAVSTAFLYEAARAPAHAPAPAHRRGFSPPLPRPDDPPAPAAELPAVPPGAPPGLILYAGQPLAPVAGPAPLDLAAAEEVPMADSLSPIP